MIQVTTNPIVAEKIAMTVIQPSAFIARPLTRSPIMLLLFVMSMINSINGGVEKPCTIPAQTNAFMGLFHHGHSQKADGDEPNRKEYRSGVAGQWPQRLCGLRGAVNVRLPGFEQRRRCGKDHEVHH